MLKYSILLIVIPSCIALVAIIVFMCGKRASKNKDTQNVVFLSHTEAIRHLPEYVKARKIYRLFVSIMLAVFGISIISCGFIAARPTNISVQREEIKNRDIMFCIDMSGSMQENTSAVIADFAELSKSLNGQRVGLTIFNNVSAQILPLSNDYTLFSDTLQDLATNHKHYENSLSVDISKMMQHSYIGEGAISCVKNVATDQSNTRSHSVILMTDNISGGEISLTQAANYSRKYDVTFYGIDYSTNKSTSQTAQEFKHAMLATGGTYYRFADNASIDAIAGKVMDQEASSNEASPRVVQVDSPELFIGICVFATIAFLLMAWSLRI